MFTFKRPKVVNQLTTLINKNPEGTTVKEVLENQDLSQSIRNEVPELLDFFCPPLPNPPSVERPMSSAEANKLKEKRQKDLALLAFTSKLNRKGDEYDNDFRYNRNASNIISSPSKKFHDRLVYYYSDGKGKYIFSPFLEELIKFARSLNPDSNHKVHHQMAFYGHFHRIFEAIIRSTKGQFFETIYKIAPDLNPFYKVILRQIHIISIRQLYITSSSEYPQQFSGTNNEKPSIVFIELSKFGAEESEKIKGKRSKGKTVKKVHIKQELFDDYNKKKSENKNYKIVKIDQYGQVKRIEYKEKSENYAKNHKSTEANQNKKRKKKTRNDHYQNSVASLLAIRDILNDSTDAFQNLRNNDIIENILKIGKNSPETSFTVSLAYNLILKISTNDKKSINDFRKILDKFPPDLNQFPKLKARVEKLEFENEVEESSGEHLIYQMPLYFLSLPKTFQDLFFSKKKYSGIFDDQFIFSIKSVLTKKEQIDFFMKDNNYFLKGLCKTLPEPPKLDLTNFDRNDQTIDPELPSIEIVDEKVAEDSLPKQRGPLYGHLWDIARYIDDEKRFKIEEIPFKSDPEWKKLHEKVVEYYLRVFAYVKEPVEEEEDFSQENSEEE